VIAARDGATASLLWAAALALALVGQVDAREPLAAGMPGAGGAGAGVRVCELPVLVDGALECLGGAPRPGQSEPWPGDVFDREGRWRGRMSPDELTALHVPLSLEAATRDELMSLPRVGRVLAERLIAGRPYPRLGEDLGELARVKGVGPATLAGLRPRVRAWPPRPAVTQVRLPTSP
jgi:hypothetical protein